MATEHLNEYRMTIDLNVLNHLGLGLYSNVPAVLSEAVANAWDADATKVEIIIDPKNGEVVIEDDGHGMTVGDANDKFLNIGYQRREDGGAMSPKGRVVMGRKGIGKLSLFSIAELVEVHSVKDGQRHGFKMDVKKIQEEIERKCNRQYAPEPVASDSVVLDIGTRIILRRMKRRLHRSGGALRRRLARRFSVIGGNEFEIILDGRPVKIEDRGYHDKLQYMWTYGSRGDRIRGIASQIPNHDHEGRTLKIESGGSEWDVDGWIGSVKEVKDLTDADTKESINQIVIMVRGKLAQEDILEEFGIGGLATKYLIGEIHADFLDMDHLRDIATSSRQRLIEDIEEDGRYEALKNQLETEVRSIVIKWKDKRNKGGVKKALEIPQIRTWFGGLNPDHKKAAEELLGRINELPVEGEDEVRRLFIGNILAFESLKFRNMLHRLDEVSTENLGVLSDVFAQLDDIEASAYYQISKDRLEVINKLTTLVDENAKERALQEHLFKHLWLLDPSWERATHTTQMETQINRALKLEVESLTPEEKRARVDIYYATTANKHVIIELKKPDRVVSTLELLSQIDKYRSATVKTLQSMGLQNEQPEIVCVVGRDLSDWGNTPDGRRVSQDMLKAQNARVVLYDQLISNAQQAYEDYLERQADAGRIYKLITSISEEDFASMSPASG